LLVITTKYEEKDGQLYVKPSKWFIGILLALLIIRTSLKSILSMSISPGEIGGMFFLLAFVMIVVWRLSMLIKFKQFNKQLGWPGCLIFAVCPSMENFSFSLSAYWISFSYGV